MKIQKAYLNHQKVLNTLRTEFGKDTYNIQQLIKLRQVLREQSTCSISYKKLSSPETVEVTTCLHAFNKASLEKWLYKNDSCPCCRTVLLSQEEKCMQRLRKIGRRATPAPVDSPCMAIQEAMATHYSKEKPLWFPDLDYTFQLISETLGSYLKSKNHILDIGAGTGNLSKTILETHKSLFITLVDFSENMLKEVPFVLSEFKGKFNTIKDDIFQMDLGKNSYNHVISSFAIHHGRTQNEYQ